MKISKLSTEEVPCVMCSSRSAKNVFSKDGLMVVRCNKCQLLYVNPRLKPTTLKELYNQGEISSHKDYSETKEADKKTFIERINLLEMRLGGRKGRILDIGCNIGTLLKIAEKRGWECYGVDINANVKPCFAKTRIKIHIGDVLLAEYPDKYFDVIVMNDLIEHVPDPKKLLKKANFFLKEEGIIFLVTPDGGSWMLKMLGKKWFHLKPKEHLFYFNKKHLRELLQQTGFSVEYMRHLKRYRSMKILAVKSLPVLGSISKYMLKITSLLHIDHILVPLNLHDEYAVIGKKKIE